MKKLLAVLFILGLLICSIAIADESVPEIYSCEDYYYILLDDGSAEIVRYKGKAENLLIPSVLDGYPVTSIREFAFYYCTSLTSVTIPDSIISIGANPFYHCTWMREVIVSPEHPYLETIDGVLFSKPDKRLVYCPCRDKTGDYTIPQGTRIVDKEAFCDCNLPTIIIPDSVISIGDYAFNNCKYLTSISIPDSVDSIGINPFIDCGNLTEITVSQNHPFLEVIDGVLYNRLDKCLICYPCAFTAEAYSVPQGVEEIGDSAFAFSRSLTHVMLPDSVTIIKEEAFRSCSFLQAVSIPDGVTSIGDWAFYYCERLTDVTIPNSVTYIGDRAFYSCESLTSITIPNSVTYIGKDAYQECRDLIVTVTRGSYAEQYCQENGIKYIYAELTTE